MKALFLVLLTAGLWYYLDTPNRRRKQAEEIERLKIKNDDKRITYRELAFMRRDLTTARNMIKLGLVKQAGGKQEYWLEKIYNGFDPYKHPDARHIALWFGLLEENENFVGHAPKRKNR